MENVIPTHSGNDLIWLQYFLQKLEGLFFALDYYFQLLSQLIKALGGSKATAPTRTRCVFLQISTFSLVSLEARWVGVAI